MGQVERESFNSTQDIRTRVVEKPALRHVLNKNQSSFMEKSVNSFVTNRLDFAKKNHQNFKYSLKWMWQKLHIWVIMYITLKYNVTENMVLRIISLNFLELHKNEAVGRGSEVWGTVGSLRFSIDWILPVYLWLMGRLGLKQTLVLEISPKG